MKFAQKYLFLLIIAATFTGCGSLSEDYFYDVIVTNKTASPITVRYGLESWIFGETWLYETTIPAGDFATIQWHSDQSITDEIEVLYQGTTRTYTVFQQDIVTVSP